jgi:hypothetical protein
MTHFLTTNETQKYSKTISSTKQTQVSNLQNHIQQILSDNYHTFLQGSYSNSTAISEINDVDIVAVRKNVYCSNHSPVIPSIINPRDFPWEEIYKDVIEKLQNQNLYNWTITIKEKCITVETTSFKADIVPVVQVHEDILQDPVSIKTSSGNQLTYPRDHKGNGILKHGATDQNYKPMIRIFKNWVKARLDKDVVSSHKIESLLHSVDTSLFSNDHLASFILISDTIIKKLQQRNSIAVIIPSVCGNEDITSNWDYNCRNTFLNELIKARDLAMQSWESSSAAEATKYWNQIFNYDR